MGTSRYVYVGAYLEILAEQKEVPWGNKCCPKCGLIDRGDYCYRCGTKMVQETELRTPYLWDLIDGEELFQANGEYGPCDDVILAIGNKSFPHSPDHICHLDSGELRLKRIHSEDISAMVHNFAENYAGSIEELRKVARAEVKFGIITYAG